jgi:ABC-type Fe3+ transport system permease subunit
MRTVTLPLLRPGMVAAWLLIFIAVALLFAVARSVSRGIALRAGEPL